MDTDRKVNLGFGGARFHRATGRHNQTGALSLTLFVSVVRNSKRAPVRFLFIVPCRSVRLVSELSSWLVLLLAIGSAAAASSSRPNMRNYKYRDVYLLANRCSGSEQSQMGGAAIGAREGISFRAGSARTLPVGRRDQ